MKALIPTLVLVATTAIANPMRDLSDSCQGCVRFFRVTRSLAPGIRHHFMGARTTVACEDQRPVRSETVYALPKSFVDLGIFQDLVWGGKLDPSARAKSIGVACGREAELAHEEAARVTEEWAVYYESTLKSWSRYAATPIMGRPCKVATDDVERKLQRFLRR